LFELYLQVGCSITKLSQQTTIPINTVSRDINKVRKEFNLTQSFNDQDLFFDNSLTKNTQQELTIQSQYNNNSHVTNKLIAITDNDINSLNKLYSNAKLNGLMVIDYLVIDKRSGIFNLFF
jgi:hypothetical protein